MINKIPVFKVWVMTFIDSSEIEIFNSREAAYEAAKEYVRQETPEYVENDLAALEQQYNEGKDYFHVEDFLWVDPSDILTVANVENGKPDTFNNTAVYLKNIRS